MPNNRYSDPLAYRITNDPGPRYTMPRVDYTSVFDRASNIVRNATTTGIAAPPYSAPTPTLSGPSFGEMLGVATKAVGWGLLAAALIAVILADDEQKAAKDRR